MAPVDGARQPPHPALDADRDALRRRVGALEADLEIVRTSMSRRVTRPLRAAGEWLRRRRAR